MTFEAKAAEEGSAYVQPPRAFGFADPWRNSFRTLAAWIAVMAGRQGRGAIGGHRPGYPGCVRAGCRVRMQQTLGAWWPSLEQWIW